MEERENLDALILELIKEKMDNARDEMVRMLQAHSEDPAAHPHAHDMDVSDAVEEHLSAAAAEIQAALDAEAAVAEEPAAEPEPEPQPEPEPEPEAPAPATEERTPERVHVLHRRIG